MQAIFETIFDIIYLSTVITLGIQMITGSRGDKQFRLYGIMAVVLGCGDAFHLVPRAVALCTTGLASYTAVLGIGKLITSITMTIFYILLYYVWRVRYQVSGKYKLTVVVWVLSLIHIYNYDLPWHSLIGGETGLGVFNGDIGEITGIDHREEYLTVRYDGLLYTSRCV